MLRSILLITTCLILFIGCATSQEKPDLTDLQKQVADTERAFARTMAQRDFEGFVSFLSEEAVFFSGKTQLHGKQQIAGTWKSYYENEDAPFSWEPELVEVLESGTLALSSGPVYDPDGKQVATFTSIWRLDKTGEWHVIFDKGNAACNCPSQ